MDGDVLGFPNSPQHLSEQVDGPLRIRIRWKVSAFLVIEKVDARLQVGLLLIGEKDLEALLAHGEDIHPAILVFPGDIDHLRGATYALDRVILGQDYSEGRLIFHTLPNHGLVARLEYVQGQRSFREQDHFEGKQGYESLFHGSFRVAPGFNLRPEGPL